MRHRPIPIVLFLCLLLWPISARAAVSITDDTGWQTTLERPAQRIIALYGAFSELILALGLDKRLVARTVADERIPDLRHLPAVGTHMRPNAELIVAHRPDVVIQLVGRQEAATVGQDLRRLGVPVLLFRMESFEDMFAVLHNLGMLMGVPERAAELERQYRTRLHTVWQRVSAKTSVSIFYEVRYPNLLGAGKHSIVNDIMSRAGGRNVVITEGKLVRLNEEELLRLNPQAYIIQQGPMNPAPMPMENRRHFDPLRAQQTGRVLIVDELQFARPGPRAVDAVEALAQWLHPETGQ